MCRAMFENRRRLNKFLTLIHPRTVLIYACHVQDGHASWEVFVLFRSNPMNKSCQNGHRGSRRARGLLKSNPINECLSPSHITLFLIWSSMYVCVCLCRVCVCVCIYIGIFRWKDAWQKKSWEDTLVAYISTIQLLDAILPLHVALIVKYYNNWISRTNPSISIFFSS